MPLYKEIEMEENFNTKKNYDKEKIKFLEEHLNEGHTKEELDEMFLKEIIEKDKEEKTKKFQELVEEESKLSYHTSGQKETDDYNTFEYNLSISRPCTLGAFVNLLALQSISRKYRTVVEYIDCSSDHILIYIQNGEVESETMEYFWKNRVIEGDKAFDNRDFMDPVERLVVGPLKKRLY